MICLGYTAAEKDACVSEYCAAHDIARVFVLTPDRFRVALSAEHEAVEWAEIIEYRFFYRLLQEIDASTLIVINECLRTQKRSDLTYNCMRHFLQQTEHQIVFQYLPLIDTFDDFMILFDFDTRSRWKRDKWRPEMRSEVDLHVREAAPTFEPIDVPTDEKTKAAYAREKRKLIDGIGLKDPHTIPRNLYLMSGKAKLPHVDTGARYVGRNNRFGLSNLETYRDVSEPGGRTVFELPHNFIDFADFLSVSRQRKAKVLRADLKVDHWYFDRYQAWAGRLADAYATLRG